MTLIDYRTEHRLSDSLALQAFVLRHHLLRRAVFLGLVALGGLVVATGISGAPLADTLTDLARNAGFYVVLFVLGLAVIHLFAFLMAWRAWQKRPLPREIIATVDAEGLSLRKDGFSYTARWRDADLVTENAHAFLMKFNQLYMRLPKRGFTPETDAAFRAFAAAAPDGARRLR